MIEKARFEIITRSPDETEQLGCKLAKRLVPGDVISLKGDLGSGKTLFTQGIGSGLHVRDAITSPSFTLVQEYRADIPMYHFDLYRLNSLSDVEDLGFDGYLESGGIVIIEWAEKGDGLIPENHISVEFSRVMEEEKRIAEGKRAIAITFPVLHNLGEALA